MQNHFFKIIIFLLFGSATEALAQDNVYSTGVLPPSPEATSFAKNVNIPMSYSSGTPQIGVSFGSVKSGSLEVQVSLSYNASGIRVEEVASWVGLGWNLNAGGQISRVIKGDADELWYGYMNVPANRKVKYVNNAHCRCSELTPEGWAIENELNVYNILDLEPDQFSFSVLGYSGDFYYNQDSARFLLFPYQNILIEGSPGNFILTLPNGVKCYFGGSLSSEEALESGTTTSYIDGYLQEPVPLRNALQGTSWMLSSLIDPAGKFIMFEYEIERIITFGGLGETFGQSITDGFSSNRKKSTYKQFIRKPVLRRISGESGNIYFTRSTLHRLDMPDYDDGSRSLDHIAITNPSNEQLKAFYFEYGYFVSSVGPSGVIMNDYLEEARRRLYLKKVIEKNGIVDLPAYEFTYSDIELPSRLSTSQDYWGYANGKINGLQLMPKMFRSGIFFPNFPNYAEDNQIVPTFGSRNPDGADRRIDANYSQARILTKIGYPTGGVTEYYYEQNKVPVSNLNIYGGMIPPDMVDKSYSFNSISVPIEAYPPYSQYFSGMFSINIPVTKVRVTTLLGTCNTYVNSSCLVTIKIKNLFDNSDVVILNTNGTFDLQLASGNYKVEAYISGSNQNQPPTFQVDIAWGERLDPINFFVGGVRVNKIINRDGLGNTISKSFTYNNEENTQSSGIMAGSPCYRVLNIYSPTVSRQYFTSNNVLPLTMEGKTVRYEFVTEYNDSEQSSFKTTYSFTSGLFSPLKFASARSGAPVLSWNWQNNLLKSKKIYEKLGSGLYRPLTEEQNFYYYHRPLIDLYGLFGHQLIAYDMATEWYLPDSRSITNYSYDGAEQTISVSNTKIYYNDFYLPSLTETTNSKDKIIHSKTWYPTDFNNVSAYNIASLYNQHIWSIPIKQETSVEGKIVSGSIFKYNVYGLPIESRSYENASLADTVVHDRNVVQENNFVLRTSIDYDANKDIKQINHYTIGPTSYIWDYQLNSLSGARMNINPIAVIQNADFNSVAYASFENASLGNWNYPNSVTIDATSPMGERCYTFGANITKQGLQSTMTYVVSYWSKNGSYTLTGNPVAQQRRTVNGWTNYIHELTGVTSLTISGSGRIDELKLYPKNAVITSYNYKASIGISSQCDVNGKITYYEYDPLGRLKLMKDQDGKILKVYDYKYQQP